MASTGNLILARTALAALRALAGIDGAMTAEQRQALQSWPGWGPLAPAFDPAPEGAWTEIADELVDLLDVDALADARECVDNSFYTPPVVIDAIYGLLGKTGIAGGRILEPGCGSGAFFTRRPAGWDVHFTGVERDATSARIAALLHPEAQIIHNSLQKANLPGGFDAVVGNVPFSSSRVHDAAHPSGGDVLHNYFIWRALDAVREGGYVVLVTSRYTMDSGAIYSLCSGVADFVGAVRLPSGTFRSGGTDVVADVIVARRNTHTNRAGYRLHHGQQHQLGGVVDDAGTWRSPVMVHGYFGDHPEQVAGQMRLTGYSRAPLDVHAEDREREIARAFATLVPALLPADAEVTDVRPAAPCLVDVDGRKEGSFHLVDGQLTRVQDSAMIPVKNSAELRALIELREAATALLIAESDLGRPDADIDGPRADALALYRSYVARYGPLNRGTLHEGKIDQETGMPALSWRRPSMGGFRRDPDYLTVMALEDYRSDDGTAAPAAILLRRVNRRPVRIEHAANPGEALAITLGEGRLDLDRVARLLALSGRDAAVVALGELIFADPDDAGRCTTARDYLSGNVRAKLARVREVAEHDPGYARNVAALEAVQPADLGPLEIAIALGAPWVSTQDVSDFLTEVIGARARVEHCAATASWEVDSGYVRSATATTTYGTSRLDGFKLVEIALNGKSPVVYDEVYTADDGKRRVRNPEQTLAAQEKLTAIAERFATWVWEDPERSARICADYNARFNSHVIRRADGSHLTFPGLSDGVQLWPWQRDIVDQILSSPATLCGHAVGAGKTISMVAAAVMARRFGLATKPMIAVPNHLLEQIAREARQAFPAGRFLIAGKEELAGDARRLFAARCATGDWDAVIITHAGFGSIPVSVRTEQDWLSQQKADLDAHLRSGDGGYFGAKEIARRVRSFEAQMEKLRERQADPQTVTFEQLGVDMLLVDECHYFKRLGVATRAEGFSFGASKRATDLIVKAAWLRQRRGAAPSLALFTGTPWSNTIAETFVWQTYCQPDALAEAGVANFDAWAAVFVERETLVEVAPDGSGFRTTTRPTRIRNVPELRAMLNRCADILPAAALGMQRPEAVEHTLVAQQSEVQHAFVLSLVDRAERLRTGGTAAREQDNMLAICGDGRRVALDPRLVEIDEDSPKVALLADTVAAVHHEHAALTLPGQVVPGVLQLIFCDQGTPGDRGAQTYGRIRAALAARGVPAESVHWVHEATDDKSRAALFTACRDGSVSVLIGSTDKLGVGTNVQTRLRAVHHADAPWRPSDIEQRNGRALRPGNRCARVDVYRYATEGTFDAFMWQTLERKARFIAQLYTADSTAREIEDIGDLVLSFGEVKALATGNPLLLEQAETVATVKRLRTLRAVDAQSVTAARKMITESQRREEEFRERAQWLREAAGVLAEHPGTDVDSSRLAEAVEQVRSRLMGDGEAGYALGRAPWRELDLRVEPEGGWYGGKRGPVLVRVVSSYRTVDEIALPPKAMHGQVARALNTVTCALDRWVTELPARAEHADQVADTAARQAAEAQGVVDGYRFAQADELVAAEARLAAIAAEIADAAGSGELAA